MSLTDNGADMDSKVRYMTEADKPVVLDMMRVFYASAAVYTNGSEEIFLNDIENCINENPYLDGYVIENGEEIQGYAMIAKSFSTEFGKPCMWIEDIYVKDEYRGCGIGSRFFDYVREKFPSALLRLEVEEENRRARAVYEKNGFDYMPYLEMKK